MLILALDTATEKGSLALVAEDQVLMEYSLESHNAYLTCLMPGVAAILRQYRQGRGGSDRRGREHRPRQLYGAPDRAGHRQDPGVVPQAARWCRCPPWRCWRPSSPFTLTPSGWSWTPSAGRSSGGCSGARKIGPRCWKGRCGCRWRNSRPGCARRSCSPVPASRSTGRSWLRLLSPEIAWAPPEMRLPRASTLARLARHRLKLGLTANPAQLVPTYLRPAL